MIRIEQIKGALPRLTGEAAKLAIELCTEVGERAVPIRADKTWCGRTAKKIGMTSAAVAKAVNELAKEKLVALRGRVEIAPIDLTTSGPGHSLARISSAQSDGSAKPAELDETDSPPWSRGAGERSETARSRNAVVCPPPGAHNAVVAAFTILYVEAYGSKPTWGPKQGAIVKRLLKSHSPDEIIRRATIMIREERKWPPPPHDLGTLSAHFDKFAVGKVRGGIVGDARKTGATYFGEVDDV